MIQDNSPACPYCGRPLAAPPAGIQEVVLKVGAVTFTNANLKDAATAIGGTLAGGILGKRAANNAAQNLAQNGHGVLTNMRFVFGSSKAFKKIPAGSPFSVAQYGAKGDIVFDIPLAEIISFTQGKQGFSTLFALETMDSVYKFALLKKTDFPEWDAAFFQARGRR